MSKEGTTLLVIKSLAGFSFTANYTVVPTKDFNILDLAQKLEVIASAQRSLDNVKHNVEREFYQFVSKHQFD